MAGLFMSASQTSHEASSVYTLKESPYSSHFLLMNEFPANGEGMRVLDLGCANGYLSARLAARGFEVVGLERAGGYGSDFPKSVRLVEADLDDGLPPLDGRFHYVLAADILEHLKEPSSLLQQLHALMHPSARLVMSLPNSGNLYFRLTVLAGRFPKHDRGLFDRTHLHFFVWQGWQTLLTESGFAIQKVRSTGIPVGLAFPASANRLPVRAAEKLSYELAGIWKTLFAYQFVVTAVNSLSGKEG
jgi:SAM-dependent methyltransferase